MGSFFPPKSFPPEKLITLRCLGGLGCGNFPGQCSMSPCWQCDTQQTVTWPPWGQLTMPASMSRMKDVLRLSLLFLASSILVRRCKKASDQTHTHTHKHSSCRSLLLVKRGFTWIYPRFLRSCESSVGCSPGVNTKEAKIDFQVGRYTGFWARPPCTTKSSCTNEWLK